MIHKKRALLVLLAVPLFLFMSAEEHGGSGGADFAGKVVNFLVLFGGLGFVLYKPVRELLAKRAAGIREDLDSAGSRRQEAEKRSEETTGRLGGLDAEVRRLRTEAEEDAQRVGQRIAGAAAGEAGKIRRFAEQEVEEQVRGGLLELKSYVAARAAALAGERIRRRLTPEDHASLIDKSIERLTHPDEEQGPRQ